MTERDFELLLQEDISALPPTDELTHAVNPWRKAMNRILWGLALVMVTLKFWNLDVILPAIGVLLMMLGYRALARENRWFKAGFVLAFLRMLWLVVHIFLDSTVYSSAFGENNAAVLGTYAVLAVGFAQLICLRGGIRAVQKKAGLQPHSGSANALLVFYLIISLLAFINFQGFTVWLLLIAYICILRGLFRLSRELDEAGYTISPAPPLFSDRFLVFSYAATIALLLAVGIGFFGQYPMEWSAVKPQSSSVESLRAELLELGFPENILNDLTDEEILACEGAEKVFVDTEDHPVNDGYETSERTSQGMHLYTAYDVYELRITAVAVQPAEQDGDWVFFHHFQWIVDPGYRGTDGMQFWPAYHIEEGWAKGGHLSGRLLYDGDSTTLTAPYHSLGEVTGTSQNMFFGEVTGTDIIATFSLPRGGENCRGYVCYTARIIDPGWIIDSWCNYYYQESLWFPFRTPEDIINPGVSSRVKPYQMVNTAMQMSYNIDKAPEEGIYDYKPVE